MGTVFQIPWTYIGEDDDITAILHEAGFTVISMALSDRALPITDPVFGRCKKKAIVFGSEGNGICQDTLSKSDLIGVIPMHNKVDSLNVAAASAVAFWELCKK